MLKDKIDVGFIGCGGHSFRNIYPAFQFAPINLIATCDLNLERAKNCAKIFGAERHYTDYHEMLEKERLDAVFIVTGYDSDGNPRYPKQAMDAMKVGCHVWMEKPPASSSAEIEDMIKVSQETKKFVLVGFKKCFFPAIVKAKEIIEKEEFGTPTSIYVRYPQSLPEGQYKDDPKKMLGFLDHIAHPGSIIVYLMGKIEHIYYERNQIGGTVTTMKFKSGAVGTLHLTAGQAGTSPLERLEVIGRGANVVVDNGVKITYYRPGSRGPGGYGRATNYIGDDSHAPIYWEPEFSLGQLYNKGLFLLGYAPEVIYFAECVLKNSPPQKCGLEDALEVTKLYEAYKRPEREIIYI